MKEITEVKEIQSISYQLLKAFSIFCDEHNLRYILAGGTMLGAVRHHGFIPWDDDIDVQMPREDYEEFLKLTQNKQIGENIAVVSEKTYDNICINYAKVIDTRTILQEDISIDFPIGIYIDIFPTDGIPNNKFAIQLYFLRIGFWKTLLELRVMKIKKGKSFFNYILKFFLVPIVRLIPLKIIIGKINKKAIKFKFAESKNVAFVVLGYGIKEVTTREKYLDRVKCQFEDGEFYIPSNYHEYLTQLYGNYMELPPKKMQVAHHRFSAFWK